MNKYEAFYRNGQLVALDVDSGAEFYVGLVLPNDEVYEGVILSNSSKNFEGSAYEIYEEEGTLYLINLDSGNAYKAILYV